MMQALEITLRPMRWWDIEPLLHIEHDLFGNESWSAELFWSEIARPDTRHYLVIEIEDRIVGYGGLCVYPDEAFIQTIAVDRVHQGHGIGARLLTALLDEAERRERKVVMLEVRADNEVAQRLYARFGFEAVGIRKGYYQPSNTDAVVMVRDAR
jgi:ribosomal-protein-alanine N-acetyltransferase